MCDIRLNRIEAVIDHMAAASLALAVAYAVIKFAPGMLPYWQFGILALVSGSIAYLASVRGLRGVGAGPGFKVPVFDLRELDLIEPDELLLTEQVELLLTEANRVQLASTTSTDELVLDDILVELGPNSRVVRLFDPASMPTPGELGSRIDRHLQGGTALSPSPDASQELYQALAELRRSLR